MAVERGSRTPDGLASEASLAEGGADSAFLYDQLLPAWFGALRHIEGLPILISVQTGRRLQLPPRMPGLRPVVREIVADHLRRNLRYLQRHFSARSAVSGGQDAPELAMIAHAQEALPASRIKQLALALAVFAAFLSTLAAALLPQGAAEFVTAVWFDLLTLNLGAVVDLYPQLDGEPGHSTTDIIYLLASLLYMGAVILLPALLLSGSFRVARLILRGSAPDLRPSERSTNLRAEKAAPRYPVDVLGLGYSYTSAIGSQHSPLMPGELLPRLLTPPLISAGALLGSFAILALPELREGAIVEFAEGYRETSPNPARVTASDFYIAYVLFGGPPLMLLLATSARSARTGIAQWRRLVNGQEREPTFLAAIRDPLSVAWFVSCVMSWLPGVALALSIGTYFSTRAAVRRRTGARRGRAERIRRWAGALTLVNLVVLWVFLATL